MRVGTRTAWPAWSRATAPRAPERVEPQLRPLMDAFPTAVAYVVNRRLDVLAWNAPATALLSPRADPPT
ncbi:MmyB family transcriptional regulator [Streptomyces sp. NPDC055897]